jgi:hypothetical protein
MAWIRSDAPGRPEKKSPLAGKPLPRRVAGQSLAETWNRLLTPVSPPLHATVVAGEE